MNCLDFDNMLGQGHFGVVLQGKLTQNDNTSFIHDGAECWKQAMTVFGKKTFEEIDSHFDKTILKKDLK